MLLQNFAKSFLWASPIELSVLSNPGDRTSKTLGLTTEKSHTLTDTDPTSELWVSGSYAIAKTHAMS